MFGDYQVEYLAWIKKAEASFHIPSGDLYWNHQFSDGLEATSPPFEIDEVEWFSETASRLVELVHKICEQCDLVKTHLSKKSKATLHYKQATQLYDEFSKVLLERAKKFDEMMHATLRVREVFGKFPILIAEIRAELERLNLTVASFEKSSPGNLNLNDLEFEFRLLQGKVADPDEILDDAEKLFLTTTEYHEAVLSIEITQSHAIEHARTHLSDALDLITLCRKITDVVDLPRKGQLLGKQFDELRADLGLLFRLTALFTSETPRYEEALHSFGDLVTRIQRKLTGHQILFSNDQAVQYFVKKLNADYLDHELRTFSRARTMERIEDVFHLSISCHEYNIASDLLWRMTNKVSELSKAPANAAVARVTIFCFLYTMVLTRDLFCEHCEEHLQRNEWLQRRPLFDRARNILDEVLGKVFSTLNLQYETY